MSSLHLTISHHLSQGEALKRVKKLLTQTKKEHSDKIGNLKESWKGNVGTFSFSAQGFTISGTISVSADNLELEGKLPFALGFFKKKIEKVIKDTAKDQLA